MVRRYNHNDHHNRLRLQCLSHCIVSSHRIATRLHRNHVSLRFACVVQTCHIHVHQPSRINRIILLSKSSLSSFALAPSSRLCTRAHFPIVHVIAFDLATHLSAPFQLHSVAQSFIRKTRSACRRHFCGCTSPAN